MIPALIDLHVRPTLNEFGHQDVELLAVQARDHGLDGVVVIGSDAAVELGETATISQATGVQVFTGVELATDHGLLLCYPRQIDDWFKQSGWRVLPRSEASAEASDGVYQAADIVKAFAERGGAVIGLPLINGHDPAAPPAGLAGIVVTGVNVDDRTVAMAQTARLACVGASAATPGQERFGKVATVFAAPPMTQEAMVDGLRSGRVWPAEIGAVLVVTKAQAPAPAPQAQAAAPAQPQAARRQDRQDRQAAPQHAPGPNALQPPGPQATNGQQAFASEAREPRARPQPPAPKPRAPKADPFERPGDNRGNRLNQNDVRRKIAPSEDLQPSFDPVASMFGLDGRKIRHWHNKTDVELDRINGNRNKGPDPNVMVMPAFDELRQERQHISLLFSGTHDEDHLDDSVALRFALSHFRRGDDGQVAQRDLPQAPLGARRGRRRRR